MKKIMHSILIILSFASLPLLSGCLDGRGFYYGGHGGYHGGYHGGWHHGGGHHGWGGHHGHGRLDESVSLSASSLAEQFGILPESATALARLAASTDSVELLKATATLGVGLDEVAPLARLSMPAQETIQKIADKLGEDRARIQNVFESFLSDVRSL